MVNNEDASERKARGMFRRLVLLLLAFGSAVALAIAAFSLLLTSMERQQRDDRFKYCQQELEKRIAEKSKYIYLYDSAKTDTLLERLVAVPGIEVVKLDMTDVTDEGMKSLAAIKGLKSLTVYGGGRVGDQGMSHLSAAASLERLQLINTRVTDQGLSSLGKLANLRSLEVHTSKSIATGLTNAAIPILKEFSGLKELRISGDWVSETDVEGLKKALPNCEVNVWGENAEQKEDRRKPRE
jgi:hypothetical protein